MSTCKGCGEKIRFWFTNENGKRVPAGCKCRYERTSTTHTKNKMWCEQCQCTVPTAKKGWWTWTCLRCGSTKLSAAETAERWCNDCGQNVIAERPKWLFTAGEWRCTTCRSKRISWSWWTALQVTAKPETPIPHAALEKAELAIAKAETEAELAMAKAKANMALALAKAEAQAGKAAAEEELAEERAAAEEELAEERAAAEEELAEERAAAEEELAEERAAADEERAARGGNQTLTGEPMSESDLSIFEDDKNEIVRSGNKLPDPTEIKLLLEQTNKPVPASPSPLIIVPESVNARFELHPNGFIALLVVVEVTNTGSKPVRLKPKAVSASAFNGANQLLFLDQGVWINGEYGGIKVLPFTSTALKIEFQNGGNAKIFAKVRDEIQTFRLDLEFNTITVGKNAVLII